MCWGLPLSCQAVEQHQTEKISKLPEGPANNMAILVCVNQEQESPGVNMWAKLIPRSPLYCVRRVGVTDASFCGVLHTSGFGGWVSVDSEALVKKESP